MAHTFTPCGTENLGITTVTVDPDSPIPGQNLTVTFAATPKQDVVTGDTYTIAVKVFGVTLGHVDFNFCTDLGVTCPVKAGAAATFHATYDIPKAAPGGVPLTAEFTAKTSAGAQYSCVDVPVTMAPAPPAALSLVQEIDSTACIHHEDKPNNKCYEACGEGSFAVTGLETKGPCPEEYMETDSSREVTACSDGVTNIKYCSGGNLRKVNLTESTKGMQGECHFKISNNKCYEGCAQSKFKMTGLDNDGTCPSGFALTESTTYVESCSDGVTNVKYCTNPLYVVNVTMRTKGEAAAQEFLNGVGNPFWVHCLHREDAANNKCYEACANDNNFKVKGLESYGKCPSKYDETDTTKNVRACSDGVTNLKYCSGGRLHAVSLTESTKGIKAVTNKAFWEMVAGVRPFDVNAECSKDSDCPSSYCQNGFCHGCFDKCCETDSDCTKKGMTYCQNDSTKMPPYFCHA
jgi:hypothetical protein